MNDERGEAERNASEVGCAWADQKAAVLETGMLPDQWPDVWDPLWISDTEAAHWASSIGAETSSLSDFEAFKLTAHHAAGERWAELVDRAREAADEKDAELEAEEAATALVGALRRDLPPGLIVSADGPRVYLLDDSGMERTVTSVAHAWRVVADWKESHTL